MTLSQETDRSLHRAFLHAYSFFKRASDLRKDYQLTIQQKFIHASLIFILLFILSCSGYQPIIPETIIPLYMAGIENSEKPEQNRQNWGNYFISINPSSLQAEVSSDRIANAHFNVTSVADSFCPDCLKVNNIFEISTDLLSADITRVPAIHGVKRSLWRKKIRHIPFFLNPKYRSCAELPRVPLI